MNTHLTYLFTSERLGFRNWIADDLPLMAAINADPRVMAFFPNVQTIQQAEGFIGRMQTQLNEKGFCYFAVDELQTGEFIGFIGLSIPTFESDFTPCIDIGWRLATKYWNKGYATEGAKRCLQYGFEQIKADRIIAIAPEINRPSIAVMEKIGMKKVNSFKHPLLVNDERLQDCVLYEIRPEMRVQ